MFFLDSSAREIRTSHFLWYSVYYKGELHGPLVTLTITELIRLFSLLCISPNYYNCPVSDHFIVVTSN